MGRSGTPQPRLTHFLCIPLVTEATRPMLASALEDFKDETAGIVSSKAIRPLDALHLTLGVMSLTQQRLQHAVRVLGNLDLQTLLAEAVQASSQGNTDTAPSTCRLPLTINLRGLESMHDAANTSILYIAPEDRSGRLQSLCLGVQKVFQQEQLLVPDDRPLKLHATILNTIYAKDVAPLRKRGHGSQASQGPMLPKLLAVDHGRESAAQHADQTMDTAEGHGPMAKARKRLDARQILAEYATRTWADGIVLDRITICEMGAKKQYDDQGRLVAEKYKEVACIQLTSLV